MNHFRVQIISPSNAVKKKSVTKSRQRLIWNTLSTVEKKIIYILKTNSGRSRDSILGRCTESSRTTGRKAHPVVVLFLRSSLAGLNEQRAFLLFRAFQLTSMEICSFQNCCFPVTDFSEPAVLRAGTYRLTEGLSHQKSVAVSLLVLTAWFPPFFRKFIFLFES